MQFELENLKSELQELGATDVQRDVFESDVPRARAAIEVAISRGAAKPISYALTLFHSESFAIAGERPKQRPVNQFGRVDPKHTDDGERIWQWDEVDDKWRRAYIEDCQVALNEGREPVARYQPSDSEYERWFARMGSLAHVGSKATAQRAISAWAEVWKVIDPDDIPF